MIDPRAVPAAHSMDTAWFGVDEDGNLALFDTGEAGAMPENAVGFGDYDQPVGKHAAGFTAISEAVKLPEDFWEEETGGPVFRFSHDTDNVIAGRYVQTYAPPRPARIEEVPVDLREAIAKLPVRFVEKPAVQPAEHLPSQSWGAVWLSADGKVARPFPGRERDAAEEWAQIREVYPDAVYEGPSLEALPPKKPWWKFW